MRNHMTRFSRSNLPVVALCAVVLFGPSSITNRRISIAHHSPAPATVTYRLDPSRSKLIAHAIRGGLLWFKGHDHLIAARKFTGEAQLTTETLVPASLQLTVDAAAMEETSEVFTPPQKEIINKELREIVLEPEKYPEIVFRSTEVTGKARGPNEYEVKIAGSLTLHGVTRRIEIPAKVTLTGDELRAVGEFNVPRSNFNVKATSAFHGLVRVKDSVEIEFDIVAHK
jgi:polyisoprenoid-binding protein YceI